MSAVVVLYPQGGHGVNDVTSGILADSSQAPQFLTLS